MPQSSTASSPEFIVRSLVAMLGAMVGARWNWSFASGPPYGNQGGQFSDYSTNPYSTPNQPGMPGMPGMPPPPKKASKLWLWLLLAFGGGGFAVCGCCGALFGGSAYFAASVGATQIQNDPVVQQQCGDIQSVNIDFMATGEEKENQGGRDVLVFRVKGSKASGTVLGFTNDDPDGERLFGSGELRLDSGETFTIFE